jgi:Bacterial regulatory helix-turn-helix protein, lysR family
MELRQLRYFVTLAEELHFGRAAAREHIVQSGLSQQLQRLERHLGVRLLERTTHHVQLTPAGSAFLVEARQILTHLDRRHWRPSAPRAQRPRFGWGSSTPAPSEHPSFRRPRPWPGALTFRAFTAMAARYAILPSPGRQRRTNRLNSGACTWRYGCVSQDGGAAIPQAEPEPSTFR